MKKLACILLLLLTGSVMVSGLRQSAQAQELSSEGKRFWVGYMSNVVGLTGMRPTIGLHISSRKNTVGMISAPALGWTQPFAVTANSVTHIELPEPLFHCRTSDIAENMGLLITADDTISVYASNAFPATTDAALVLPEQSLGNEYMLLSYKTFNSEFMIVATEDNTPVDITLTASSQGGRASGTTFQVMLNKGQVYQMRAMGSGSQNQQDFTGTRIRTTDCKKIAVFAGNDCAYVPQNAQACDHLYEQMFPTIAWGKMYLTIPFKPRKNGDTFRILAAYNNTLITVNGGAPINKNAGQFHEVVLPAASVIKANKPVLVAQYSNGTSFDNVMNADPFMLLLSPVEQKMADLTFSTIAGNNVDHFVNIWAESSQIAAMKVDGAALPAGSIKTFPGAPEYAYVQFTLEQGTSVAASHRVELPRGFGAYVYGFGVYDSYGYAGGGSFKNLALDFTYNEPLCSGKEILFTPQVFYTPMSYYWDFGDGTTSTASNPKHTYTANGTYKVSLILERSGCAKDTLTKILILDTKAKAEAGPDATICRGDTAWLEASGGTGYLWSPSMGLSQPDKKKTAAFPQKTTVYRVMVQDSLCGTAWDSTTVHVLPDVKAAFTYNRDSLTVQFHADTAFGAYKWLWDFGDRSTPSEERSPNHTYVQQDEFWVTLIAWNTCGSDTIKFLLKVDGNKKDSGKVGISGPIGAKSLNFRIHPVPVKEGFYLSGYFNGQPITLELFNNLGQVLVKLELPVQEGDRQIWVPASNWQGTGTSHEPNLIRISQGQSSQVLRSK